MDTQRTLSFMFLLQLYVGPFILIKIDLIKSKGTNDHKLNNGTVIQQKISKTLTKYFTCLSNHIFHWSCAQTPLPWVIRNKFKFSG